MKKEQHPAIKLTNAVIEWFSSPNRYVKSGMNIFEDRKGNWLSSNDSTVRSLVCKTCLCGAVDLHRELLGIKKISYRVKIMNLLRSLNEFKGFAHKYTTPQAREMFVKVKKQLQKELR